MIIFVDSGWPCVSEFNHKKRSRLVSVGLLATYFNLVT
jgi:hypothetical protein